MNRKYDNEKPYEKSIRNKKKLVSIPKTYLFISFVVSTFYSESRFFSILDFTESCAKVSNINYYLSYPINMFVQQCYVQYSIPRMHGFSINTRIQLQQQHYSLHIKYCTVHEDNNLTENRIV